MSLMVRAIRLGPDEPASGVGERPRPQPGLAPRAVPAIAHDTHLEG